MLKGSHFNGLPIADAVMAVAVPVVQARIHRELSYGEIWDTFIRITGELEVDLKAERTRIECEVIAIEDKLRDYGGDGYGYKQLCEDVEEGKVTQAEMKKYDLENLKLEYESWKNDQWDPLRMRLMSIAEQALQQRELEIQETLVEHGGEGYTISRALEEMQYARGSEKRQLQAILGNFESIQGLRSELQNVLSDVIEGKERIQLDHSTLKLSACTERIVKQQEAIFSEYEEEIVSIDMLLDSINQLEVELIRLEEKRALGKARRAKEQLAVYRELCRACDEWKACWDEYFHCPDKTDAFDVSETLPRLIQSLKPNVMTGGGCSEARILSTEGQDSSQVAVGATESHNIPLDQDLGCFQNLPDCALKTLLQLIIDLGSHAEGRGRTMSSAARASALSLLREQADAEGLIAEIPAASSDLRDLLQNRRRELHDIGSPIEDMTGDIKVLRDRLVKNPDIAAKIRMEQGEQVATLERHLELILAALAQEQDSSLPPPAVASIAVKASVDVDVNVDQLVAELLPMGRQRHFKCSTEKEKILDLIGRVQKCWEGLEKIYKAFAKEYLKDAISLLKELQPLNVRMIVQLLQESDKVAHQIKDKNIVLLLGFTGSGKTTTIRSLAGPARATQLGSFVASASADSVTRTINAIEISSPSGDKLVLCDSAGFLDNRSVEISIANNIGMQRALRQCASIKPLVVLSAESVGDRGDGFVSMAAILARMFTTADEHTAEIEQDTITRRSAFTYVFTKYTQSSSRRLQAMLQGKADKQMEGGPVRKIVQDMALHADAHLALLLAEPASRAQLDAIFLRLKDASCIENLAETVQDFTDPIADSTLRKYFDVQHLGIAHDLKCVDGSSVPRLLFKLSELRLLASVAQLDVAQHAYDKAVRQVFECIRSLKANAETALARIIDDGNAPREEDVQLVLGHLFHLFSLEPVRRVHWSEGCGGSDMQLDEYTAHRLCNAQTALLHVLQERCDSQEQTGQAINHASSDKINFLGQCLEKMRLLVNQTRSKFADNFFAALAATDAAATAAAAATAQRLAASHEEACKKTRDNFFILLGEAKEVTSKLCFHECLDHFDSLRQATAIWGPHINVTGFNAQALYKAQGAEYEAAIVAQCAEWQQKLLKGDLEDADVIEHGRLHAFLVSLWRVSTDQRTPFHCNATAIQRRLTEATNGAKVFVEKTAALFDTEKVKGSQPAESKGYDEYASSFFPIMKLRLSKVALMERLPVVKIVEESKSLRGLLSQLLRQYQHQATKIVEKVLVLGADEAVFCPRAVSILKSSAIDCDGLCYLLSQLYSASVLDHTGFEDIASRLFDYVHPHCQDSSRTSSPTESSNAVAGGAAFLPPPPPQEKWHLSIGNHTSVRRFAKSFAITSCVMSVLKWEVEGESSPSSEGAQQLKKNVLSDGVAIVRNIGSVKATLSDALAFFRDALPFNGAELSARLDSSSPFFQQLQQYVAYLLACDDSSAFFCVQDDFEIAAACDEAIKLVSAHLAAFHDRLRCQRKYSWLLTEVGIAPEDFEDDAMEELLLGMHYLRRFDQCLEDDRSDFKTWVQGLTRFYDSVSEGGTRMVSEAELLSLQLLIGFDVFMPGEKKFKALHKFWFARLTKHVKATAIMIQNDEFTEGLADSLMKLHKAAPEDFEQHWAQLRGRVEAIVRDVDTEIRKFQLGFDAYWLVEKLRKLNMLEMLVQQLASIAPDLGKLNEMIRRICSGITSPNTGLMSKIGKEISRAKADLSEKFAFCAVETKLDEMLALKNYLLEEFDCWPGDRSENSPPPNREVSSPPFTMSLQQPKTMIGDALKRLVTSLELLLEQTRYAIAKVISDVKDNCEKISNVEPARDIIEIFPPREVWLGLEAAAQDTTLESYKLHDVDFYKGSLSKLLRCVVGQLRLFLLRACRLHGADIPADGWVQIKGRPSEDAWIQGKVVGVEIQQGGARMYKVEQGSSVVSLKPEDIRSVSIEEAEATVAAYIELYLPAKIKSDTKLRATLSECQSQITRAKDSIEDQISRVSVDADLDMLVEQLALAKARRDRNSVRAIEGYLRTRLQKLCSAFQSDSSVGTALRNVMKHAAAWQQFCDHSQQNRQEFLTVIREVLSGRIRDVLQPFEGLKDTSLETVHRCRPFFEALTALLELARASAAEAADLNAKAVLLSSVGKALKECDSTWECRTQDKFGALVNIFLNWIKNCEGSIATAKDTVTNAIDEGKFPVVAWDPILKTITTTFGNLYKTVYMWEQVRIYCCHGSDPLSIRVQQTKPDIIDAFQADFQQLLATCTRPVMGSYDYWDEKLGTTTPNPADHDKFYALLNICLKVFNSCHPLIGATHGSLSEVDVTFEEMQRHVAEQITNIFLERGKAYLQSNDFARFNICVDNLRSAAANIDDSRLKHLAMTTKSELDDIFKQMAREMQQRYRKTPEMSVESTAEGLADMRSIAARADLYTQVMHGLIAELLESYKKDADGALFICNLVGPLESFPNGASVVAEHSVFEQFRNYDMNQKFASLTIEKLLLLLKSTGEGGCDTREKGRIYIAYGNIMRHYKHLVQTGKRDRSLVQTLPCQASRIVSSSMETNQRTDLVIAHVLAHWSLSNLRSYDDAMKTRSMAKYSNSDYFIKQPHAGQVVAILRMLGCDKPKAPVAASRFRDSPSNFSPQPTLLERAASAFTETFMPWRSPPVSFKPTVISDLDVENHFVQLGTGEGKSIVLAVTAIVLALFGYDVDCGCYSEYLTERDGTSFQPLFAAFGVQEQITYGTFDGLCERLLNKHGDVRSLVSARVNGDGELSAATTAGLASGRASVKTARPGVTVRPSVLLIDEVDVFFNPKFYGMPYSALTRVRGPEIDALVRLVWSKVSATTKTAPQLLGELTGSAKYKACAAKYDAWKGEQDGQQVCLVEEALKMMIADLRSFDDPSHQYLVLDGKIHYSDGSEKTTCSMVKGYKTMFAYFKAHEAGDVTEGELEAQICILLKSGMFSYAEIPKLYTNVLGVTGTLITLSDPEKEILKTRYNVRDDTLVPSVYGKKKVEFLKDSPADMKICDTAFWFTELVNEIGVRLKGQGRSKRAVMVFFDTQKDLDDFRKSEECKGTHGHFDSNDLHVFTSSTPPEFYEAAVLRAVVPGTVTLLTKELGRGTNFKPSDDDLNASGGVAVIQTFVSLEYSEEVQIRGRTARQGANGSYCMVLDAAALEQIGMTAAEVQAMRDTGRFHSTIDKKRKEKFADDYPEKVKYVDSIASFHYDSLDFLEQLRSGSPDNAAVCHFLLSNNKASNAIRGGVHSCTVVAIDATGSMSRTLDACKHTVMTMFIEAHEVLKQQRRNGAFELQICFYRNYSSGSGDILLASTWESEPANLTAFVDKVRVSGGQGNEAIEVALQHVNSEAKATQVILIGDMPPNTVEEVDKRRRDSRNAWSETRFATPTDTEAELATLKRSRIPVHAFWVDESAEEAFQRIAAETGGRSDELDISSPDGAEMLKQLVVTTVLRDVGTRQGGNSASGEELVKAYERLFGSGHV